MIFYLSWATIAIVTACTFSFVLATIFECVPVQKSWNPQSAGHCIDLPSMKWSWAAYNTVFDLWICVLPLPVFLRLKMSLIQRGAALFILVLGLFVTATSAIRMHALKESLYNTDTTWTSARALMWSHVEASVGLIAACLPSMKIPFVHLLPARWTRSPDSSLTSGTVPGRSVTEEEVFGKDSGWVRVNPPKPAYHREGAAEEWADHEQSISMVTGVAGEKELRRQGIVFE